MSAGSILITGISGRLGRLVAKRLHGDEPVIGIDRRPFPGRPKDLVLHHLDLRRKRCEDVFRRDRPKAVVHMGILHDPRASASDHHSFNLGGTNNVLEWSAKYGVPKVVVLSSANVYGPLASNSSFLGEDTPLLGSQGFPDIRDLVAVDRTAQSFFWKHPEVQTIILRPVHIVGPHVRNAPSNYLRLRYPPVLAGFDPMVQIIHEEDVVTAIITAVKAEVRGIFNVVGPGEVPLRRVLAWLGRRTVPVPHPVATRLFRRMWLWRLTSFPTPELDHIKYQCIVDGARARDLLGFRPRLSMAETIDSLRYPAV